MDIKVGTFSAIVHTYLKGDIAMELRKIDFGRAARAFGNNDIEAALHRDLLAVTRQQERH